MGGEQRQQGQKRKSKVVENFPGIFSAANIGIPLYVAVNSLLGNDISAKKLFRALLALPCMPRASAMNFPPFLSCRVLRPRAEDRGWQGRPRSDRSPVAEECEGPYNAQLPLCPLAIASVQKDNAPMPVAFRNARSDSRGYRKRGPPQMSPRGFFFLQEAQIAVHIVALPLVERSTVLYLAR